MLGSREGLIPKNRAQIGWNEEIIDDVYRIVDLKVWYFPDVDSYQNKDQKDWDISKLSIRYQHLTMWTGCGNSGWEKDTWEGCLAEVMDIFSQGFKDNATRIRSLAQVGKIQEFEVIRRVLCRHWSEESYEDFFKRFYLQDFCDGHSDHIRIKDS